MAEEKKQLTIDWENIRCPVCDVKRMRNSNNNKIFYNPDMSNKKNRKMTYHCTNHEGTFVMFVVQVFTVKDQIVSVNKFVFDEKNFKTE